MTKKKNDLESVLRRLEEIDAEIDNNSNPDELLDEINEIIKSLSDEDDFDTQKILSAKLKFINKSSNPDPSFACEGDSGFDIRAYLPDVEIIHLMPKAYCVVSTGLYFEVEKGLEIQIRPRSGIAYEYGITIVNSPGTIDSHYRGEVKIILANLGNETFTIKNGDRIAQAVVSPVYGESNLTMEKVEKLSETKRGSGGFGHTGKD